MREGRFLKENLQEFFPPPLERIDESPLFLVCGPKMMNEMAQKYIEELGHHSKNIFVF